MSAPGDGTYLDLATLGSQLGSLFLLRVVLHLGGGASDEVDVAKLDDSRLRSKTSPRNLFLGGESGNGGRTLRARWPRKPALTSTGRFRDARALGLILYGV